MAFIFLDTNIKSRNPKASQAPTNSKGINQKSSFKNGKVEEDVQNKGDWEDKEDKKGQKRQRRQKSWKRNRRFYLLNDFNEICVVQDWSEFILLTKKYNTFKLPIAGFLNI